VSPSRSAVLAEVRPGLREKQPAFAQLDVGRRTRLS
jgi:hypothetical protein